MPHDFLCSPIWTPMQQFYLTIVYYLQRMRPVLPLIFTPLYLVWGEMLNLEERKSNELAKDVISSTS